MKYLLYLLSACLLPAPIFAQVSIGPIIGLNNTQYSYLQNKKHVNPDRYGLAINYRIGAVGEILLDNKKLYLQPGIVFARNREIRVNIHQDHDLFNINTIEIPVSLMLKSAPYGKKCWLLYGGIVFGLNIGGANTVHRYSNTGQFTGTERIPLKINKDTVNGINPALFGIHGGIGYQFNQNVSMRLFVQNVFTNLIKKPYPSDYSVTRMSYGLAFAYEFPLKIRKRIIIYKKEQK